MQLQEAPCAARHAVAQAPARGQVAVGADARAARARAARRGAGRHKLALRARSAACDGAGAATGAAAAAAREELPWLAAQRAAKVVGRRELTGWAACALRLARPRLRAPWRTARAGFGADAGDRACRGVAAGSAGDAARAKRSARGPPPCPPRSPSLLLTLPVSLLYTHSLPH